MPETMTMIRATEILRGHGNPGCGDLLAAGQRVSVELTRLYRIEVWAARLVEATDEVSAGRARRGLAEALAQR